MISFQDFQNLRIAGHALARLGIPTKLTVSVYLHHEIKSLQQVKWIRKYQAWKNQTISMVTSFFVYSKRQSFPRVAILYMNSQDNLKKHICSKI